MQHKLKKSLYVMDKIRTQRTLKHKQAVIQTAESNDNRCLEILIESISTPC